MEETLILASEDLIRASRMMAKNSRKTGKKIANILYDIGFSIIIKGEVNLHLKGNKKMIRTVVKSLAIIIDSISNKHNLQEFFRNRMRIEIDYPVNEMF